MMKSGPNGTANYFPAVLHWRITDTTFGLRWLRDSAVLPPKNREVPMKSTSAENVFFDDQATHAMGAAFDEACSLLTRFASTDAVRDLIARRIIEAAKTGEREEASLRSQALFGFFIEDILVPAVSIVPEIPIPAYALVPRAA
jgi:hypothetical protein